MMRGIFLFVVFIYSFLPLCSQTDTLVFEKKTIFSEREFLNSAKASSALFLTGLCAINFDKDVRRFRNDKFLSFHQTYDNYLLLAPLGLMYGMKSFGYNSQSTWTEILILSSASLIIKEIIVYPTKIIIARERPDGSEHNSFPSGHTATAFACAHLLHREYGELSPWISVAGYSMAGITGMTRVLNNRHWLSDVLFGAGIGILSTELGYMVKGWVCKKKTKRMLILNQAL